MFIDSGILQLFIYAELLVFTLEFPNSAYTSYNIGNTFFEFFDLGNMGDAFGISQ